MKSVRQHRAVAKRPAVAGEALRPRRNAVATDAVAPITNRGAQTRERLKLAAVEVLEQVGFRHMRIADIAKHAHVPTSLFYHYFKSKTDITREVLTEFLDRQAVYDTMPEDPFDNLVAINLHVVDGYLQAPGLMRCLVQLDEEEADFASLYRKVSLDWNRRVARNIARRVPENSLTEAHRLIIAYALGGMVDSFLFEMYVNRNPQLRAACHGPHSVALFLAVMWYRALYLKNPPVDKLGEFAVLETLKF